MRENPASRGTEIGGRRPGAGDIVLIPPTNDVSRVALAGKSLPALLLLLLALAVPACQLAPPRATRSAPVAWALRARRLRREPDLRLALRARRSAHGAARREGAARLCAGRRSRWLPSPPRATHSAAPRWRAAEGKRGLCLVLRDYVTRIFMFFTDFHGRPGHVRFTAHPPLGADALADDAEP